MLRKIRIDRKNAETLLKKFVLKYEGSGEEMLVKIGDEDAKKVSYDEDEVSMLGEDSLSTRILDHIRRLMLVFEDGKPPTLGKRFFKKYSIEELEKAKEEIDVQITAKKEEKKREVKREGLQKQVEKYEKITAEMESIGVNSREEAEAKIKKMKEDIEVLRGAGKTGGEK